MKKLFSILIALVVMLLNIVSCDVSNTEENVDLDSSSDIGYVTDLPSSEKSTEQIKETEKNDGGEENRDENKEDDAEDKEDKEEKEEGEEKEDQALEPLPESSEGLWFVLNEDGKGYTLTSNHDCESSELVVGQYNGLPVTAIASTFRMRKTTSRITIGHSVTELHPENFVNISTCMTNITVQNGNPAYQGTGDCLVEIATRTLILGSRSSIIPDDGSVTTIGKESFRRLNGLLSIVIPDTVTVIEESAFHNCDSLNSVVLSKNLKSIGDRAFEISDLAGELIIPEGVTYIGRNAFLGSKLSSVTIPSTIKNIADAAFCATPLESVTISPGVVSIGESAFASCAMLESIVIPEGVTVIEEDAFADCSSLKKFSIPNSLERIPVLSIMFLNSRELEYNEYGGGYYLGNDTNPYVCFSRRVSSSVPFTEIHPETRIISASSLSSVTGDVFIPKKVHWIHEEAVNKKRRDQITSWSIDKDNPVYHSTSNCVIESATGTIVLGNSSSVIPNVETVTVIGTKAFWGSKATVIDIPKNIKKIQTLALAYCSNLEIINYGGTVDEWKAIEKEKDWNDETKDYVVKCTDGEISKAEDK